MLCLTVYSVRPLFLQIIVCVTLLLNLLGVSALAGLGILLVMGPIQGRIMQKLTSIRKRVTAFTDRRVKLTKEMLQGVVRSVTVKSKSFCWRAFLRLPAIDNRETDGTPSA